MKTSGGDMSRFGWSGPEDIQVLDPMRAAYDPSQPRAKDGQWSSARVFHGTSQRRLEAIRSEGLTINNDPNFKESSREHVYVTTSEKEALEWGYSVAGDRFRKNTRLVDVAILEIEIPAIELSKLTGDKNFPASESLKQFQGHIKPEWIKGVKGKVFDVTNDETFNTPLTALSARSLFVGVVFEDKY